MNFKDALQQEFPLQIVGTVNAYCALLAQQIGYKAIYLSGAGVANASIAIPDLAMTTLHDVLEDAKRITDAVSIPLLVDIDTGWGGHLSIMRAIKLLESANIAAIHMEDQIEQKRCGHRPNKVLISAQEMEDKIKAAVDARINPHFFIIARTDALASEGIEKAIERSYGYLCAGADAIFLEAVTDLEQYIHCKKELNCPILANITEFGKTPLFTLDMLREAKIDMALYPLSAFRAMNLAAEKVYKTLREKGTQASVIKDMQTRDQLYETLNYEKYENLLDNILKKKHE